MLGEDHVVECRLLNVEKPGALRDLTDNARPSLPMRGVAMKRKNPTVHDRVAAKPFCRAPAESLAIAFPAQRPAEKLGPLIVALIGAIDLGRNRDLIPPGRRDVELHSAPVLQPRIRVDPQISLVTGKMASQKGSRELCLARLGSVLAARKVDVPIGANQVANPLGQPNPLLRHEPEIEDTDRRVAAMRE